MKNRTIDVFGANVFALILLVVLGGLSLWVWQFSGRLSELNPHMIYGERRVKLLIFVFGTLAGILVHELLHGIAFAHYAKSGWKGVSFGIHWHSLTPYCHGDEPIMVKHYFVVALLPLFILGIIPWGIGLWVGNGILTIWGLLFIAAACGDIAMSWALRQEKYNAYVLDHPSEPGCLVSDEEITEIPTFEPANIKQHKKTKWLSILFAIMIGIVYNVTMHGWKKHWDNAHAFYGTASTQEMADKFIGILRESPEFVHSIHMSSKCESAQAAEIRRYFQLDTLFSPDATTWEKGLAIAAFVNSHIPTRNQKETPQRIDAIGLWEYTLNVEPAFNARYHAILTFELLQSAGIEARTIWCHSMDENDLDCMVVNHVWIPELNKWAMLTTCYTQNWVSNAEGTPLSLRELRESYIQGKGICYHSLGGDSNTKHDWFYAYMAKNTYWFEAFETEQLGMLNLPWEERGTLIALIPAGYSSKQISQNSHVVCTHDENTFWAVPINQ